MSDPYIANEKGIAVRDSDGRYQAVPTPAGFTPEAFRRGVSAFDAAYRYHGKLPSVKQVHEFWPRIPQETYAALLLTDEFIQAMRYRGIEWDVDSGLSNEQSMALIKMTDWTDKRSTGAKLKELGIPLARWQAWNRQPLFAESYRRRTEDNFRDAIPVAMNALIAKADSQDVRAIQLVLEVSGRWNPAQMQLEDARTVVRTLLEAIIRHVKSADERQAVLSEVAAIAATLGGINTQPTLEG